MSDIMRLSPSHKLAIFLSTNFAILIGLSLLFYKNIL